MKGRVDELIKKGVFIEKVTLGKDGHFLCSEIVKPTQKEILEFILKGCAHSIDETKLAYDEWGWLNDSRYCAICNCFLDNI